ncbi:hypothetical protein [Sinorhizobium meliloti]|uniref:hypothetical protein n=1 Tax=Rhizobium meliloti TaxID=382 RepID=UPI00398CBB7B
MIIPADYSALKLLCWNRDPNAAIDRETAWALYKRNWRLVWQESLSDPERQLIESLQNEFGEVLLGTEGPLPPWAQRDTPS